MSVPRDGQPCSSLGVALDRPVAAELSAARLKLPFLQAAVCALSSRMNPQPPRSRGRESSGPRFTPVPVKARHDGWTPARQFRFIEMLATTRSVTRACAAVGMSRESAYALRDRPEAAGGFALAWRRALAPDFQKAPRPSKPDFSVSKVDEAKEVEGPPDSPGPPSPDRQFRQLCQLLRAGCAPGISS